MSKLRKIEVDFPCEVDVPPGFFQAFDSLINMICKKYEKANPGRVMWTAAMGSKRLSNPMMLADDEPMEFDDSVYHVEVSEREDFHNRRKGKKNGVGG